MIHQQYGGAIQSLNKESERERHKQEVPGIPPEPKEENCGGDGCGGDHTIQKTLDH
jgi:hypothetical protein